MRFFFACYCFGGPGAQSLIGVYKRGLRIGLELARRGHEVTMWCSGREFFHDALTHAAERELRFVEVDTRGGERRLRRACERALTCAAPDVVVIGEAPLSGGLLAMAQAAALLQFPLVVLDNAYSAGATRAFLADHGALADGIVLTGLSACHLDTPPPRLCQVPPFVQRAPDAGRALLAGHGREPEGLVTVLGYDAGTARLGLSLLEQLDAPWRGAVLIVNDPEAWGAELGALRPEVRARLAVVRPPPEPELFGLLELSRLAVGKYGFMQFTEALALGTPLVLRYHAGPHWWGFLPEAVRQFAVVTGAERADREVAAAAARLFAAPREEVRRHAAARGLDAAGEAADFLECVRRGPEPVWDPRHLGLSRERVRLALERLHANAPVEVESVRATLIRRTPGGGDVLSLSCCYRVGPWPQRALLWGRRYPNTRAAERDYPGVDGDSPRRRVLCFSARGRLMLELDLSERALPAPA